jgi:hypothetical protein
MTENCPHSKTLTLQPETATSEGVTVKVCTIAGCTCSGVKRCRVALFGIGGSR